MNLRRARRPRHEQLYAQHVPPVRHGEDGRHPGSYPLEVFGRSDDPNQEDAPRGDGAGGVACEEVPHERHLMRYADAGREEQDGAVGVEALRAAVGAFDESGEGDAAVRGSECSAVETFGEARTVADDQGHGGLGQGEGVGGWSRG